MPAAPWGILGHAAGLITVNEVLDEYETVAVRNVNATLYPDIITDDVVAKDKRRPPTTSRCAAAVFNDVSDHVNMLGGIGTSDAAQPKSNAAKRTIIAIGSRIGWPQWCFPGGAFANHEFQHCCKRC